MADVKAKISTSNTGPKQVSVTVPAQTATAANKLRNMLDVNSAVLADGSVLQYDSATDKFVTRTDISTTTGTLSLNGGVF